MTCSEVTKEGLDPKSRARAWAEVMVLLPTPQVEKGEQLVFFGWSMAGRDKVKTSVGNEPKRCK